MTKFALYPLAAAALALSACSSGDDADENISLQEAEAEMEKLERPMAGQYEQKVQVRTLEVPGAPKEMVEQMRTMMESQAGKSFCLTEEQAAKGFEEMYRQVTQQQNCDYEKLEVSGGDVTARMTCKGEQGVNVQMELDGSATPTSSDMVMKMNTTGGPMSMNVEMAMQAERVGDCEGGASAG